MLMICDFFDLFSFLGGGGSPGGGGGAAFLWSSGSNARKFATSVFFASAAFATSKMFDMAIELVCCRNNTERS